MNSKIDLLKERVAARLRGLGDFDGVPVLTYRDGDLQATIETSVGTTGLCVLVTVRQALPSAYPTLVPFFEPVTLDLNLIENLLVNTGPGGRGTAAFALAEVAARALQGWCPLSDDPANRYFLLRCDPVGFTELTAPVSASGNVNAAALNSVLGAINASSAHGLVIVSARFLVPCLAT